MMTYLKNWQINIKIKIGTAKVHLCQLNKNIRWQFQQRQQLKISNTTFINALIKNFVILWLKLRKIE